MKERMDENEVEISGSVIKIWRRDRHIFARLATQTGNKEAPPPRFTVKFPDGSFNGEGITLMAGDALRIRGWITDEPYYENLSEFLARAKNPIRMDNHFDLKKIGEVRVKRALTAVIPEQLEPLPEAIDLNKVVVEGVIARAWEHKAGKYVRLAVYHRHTRYTGEEGNHGRPRREPSYMTVQFSDGLVDGRAVKILPKRETPDESGLAPHDRVTASGMLAESFYSQSLHSFLLEAKRIDVLHEMPDASEAANVWSSYTQTVITARKLVQYT